MREFFRGWRRKAGCVLLVMACVFMAGWFRSNYISDRILVPGRFSRPTLTSTIHGIGFEYFLHDVMPFPAYSWETIPRSVLEKAEADTHKKIEIANKSGRPVQLHRWELCGVFVETFQNRRCVRLSYWWIISPLTVLSAYLVLWIPRAKESHHA